MTTQLPTVAGGAVDENLVRFHEGLSEYLESLGLPSKDILVPVDERRGVVTILPSVVSRMTPEQREAAPYISKFTAVCRHWSIRRSSELSMGRDNTKSAYQDLPI